MCDECTWLGRLSGAARKRDKTCRILKGPDSLHLAAPQIHRTVWERLRRDGGALPVIERHAVMPRGTEFRRAQSPRNGEFDRHSPEIALESGVMWRGCIWKGTSPVRPIKVLTDDNSPRPALARKERLRAASALRVKLGDTTRERRPTTKARRQSEWDYRMLFEQAHDAIIVFTPEDEIVLDVNKRACEVYGFGKSEFIGMSLEAISKDVARGKLRIAETLEKGDYLNFETVQYRKDGGEMFLEINASVVNYQGVRAILSINRDVTERKRAEESAEASREEFSLILNNVEEIVYRGEFSEDLLHGWLTLINSQTEPLLGYQADEFLSNPSLWADNIHPDDLPFLVEQTARVARGEPATRMYRLKHKLTGEYRWLEDRIIPEFNDRGTVVGFFGATRDVTERKRAEEERAQLLRRLVTAHEEERRRIALELHDRLGQYSAALMLGLKSLKGPDFVTPAGDECVRRLINLTDQLGREMHRLAWELRPSSLDDSGLQTALRSYLEEWSAHSGLSVDFHDEGPEERRFPPTVETAVYRIVQEALTNVVKHARAHHVSVTLKCRRDVLRAVVEDDGQGFDVEAVMHAQETQHRIGLIGMHERARLVGGDIEIESSHGAGTTVFVRVPFGPDEEG